MTTKVPTDMLAEVTSKTLTSSSSLDEGAIVQLDAEGKIKPALMTTGTLAQGDVLYYNGSNLVNLGAGTSGQFLKTQGADANPVWATVAAGLEFVSEVLASTSSTVAFTGLEAGYDYEVRAHNLTVSTDLAYLDMVYGTGGTPTYVTSNYMNQTIRSVTSTLSSKGNTSDSHIGMWEDNGLGNAAGEEGSFIIHIFDPNSATRTQMIGESYLMDDSSNPRRLCFGGHNTMTTAVTALKWTLSDGTVSGTFRLYRRANA